MKTLVVLALVAMPLLAHGEEMWKWRDARGRLHYSNVPEKVPPHATEVKARLGYLDGNLPAPDLQELTTDLEYYKKLRTERAKSRATGRGWGSPPVSIPQGPIVAAPGAVPGAGYQGTTWGYPVGYLSYAGYDSIPYGGYIPFPEVPAGKTPPVGAWLWVAGYELAWRELGVTF